MKIKTIIKYSLIIYLVVYAISYVVFVPRIHQKLICQDAFGKVDEDVNCLSMREKLFPYISISKQTNTGETEVTNSMALPILPFLVKYHGKTQIGLWSAGSSGYAYPSIDVIKYTGISWID